MVQWGWVGRRGGCCCSFKGRAAHHGNQRPLPGYRGGQGSILLICRNAVALRDNGASSDRKYFKGEEEFYRADFHVFPRIVLAVISLHREMESYVLINLEGEGEEEIKNRNLKIMLLYMQGKFKLEDGES